MIIQKPEEIELLKDYEQVSQKIEKIKTMLHEMNCTSGISSMSFCDKTLRLELEVSFPVT